MFKFYYSLSKLSMLGSALYRTLIDVPTINNFYAFYGTIKLSAVFTKAKSWILGLNWQIRSHYHILPLRSI